MDTRSLVAVIVTVCLIGAIFLGAVLFLKFTQRARTEVVKSAQKDAQMRYNQAEIMGIVNLHNGRLDELTPVQRLEYDRYQVRLRESEQARMDLAMQEGIYRGPGDADGWRYTGK